MPQPRSKYAWELDDWFQKWYWKMTHSLFSAIFFLWLSLIFLQTERWMWQQWTRLGGSGKHELDPSVYRFSILCELFVVICCMIFNYLIQDLSFKSGHSCKNLIQQNSFLNSVKQVLLLNVTVTCIEISSWKINPSKSLIIWCIVGYESG